MQRGLGDVLLAWENEAYLSLEELGPDQFEIVTPSVSIRADPPVAVVDGNVDAKGTRKAAEAYLSYLYADEGQKIAAKHFYRPIKPEAADPKDIARFPNLKLATIDDFGGWKASAAEILRRRWYIRPDLQAGKIIPYAGSIPQAVAVQAAECHSGLRNGARRYVDLAHLHHPYSDFRARLEIERSWLGEILVDRTLTRGRSPRFA